ncbi:MAG: hypothetical protein V4678_00505 [Patescibacteria group bacterium]
MSRITCKEAAGNIIRENGFDKFRPADEDEYVGEHSDAVNDAVFDYVETLPNEELFSVMMTCDDSLDWSGGISQWGSQGTKRQMLMGFAGWAIYLTAKQQILKQADAAV